MKLARHLASMPDRLPSAREILLELIEAGDIEVAAGGAIRIVFEPDAVTLDALMCFDSLEREDEQIRDDYCGPFAGEGSAA